MGFFETIKKHFITMFRDPSILEVITEKIGGGPHGYGDPEDWSIRDDEYLIFPRMVWIKVRFDICKPHFDCYFNCLNNRDPNKEDKEVQKDCSKLLWLMDNCRKTYYETKNDEVELQCVKEYLILRNEYRRTADPAVLEKMKDMMLPPLPQEKVSVIPPVVKQEDQNFLKQSSTQENKKT